MNCTKPCRYILNEENCPFGKRCRFLHQYEGEPLKKQSVPHCDKVKSESGDAKRIYSTELKETTCSIGGSHNIPPSSSGDQPLDIESCTEACDNLHSTKDQVPAHSHAVRGDYDRSDELYAKKKHTRRKSTPVCRFYFQHGSCKFGEKCRFVHSEKSQGSVAIKSVEKPPPPPPKLDEAKVVESTKDSQHHPPPLTLASFIGGRPHIQRPRKTNQSNTNNSLREVSTYTVFHTEGGGGGHWDPPPPPRISGIFMQKFFMLATSLYFFPPTKKKLYETLIYTCAH